MQQSSTTLCSGTSASTLGTLNNNDFRAVHSLFDEFHYSIDNDRIGLGAFSAVYRVHRKAEEAEGGSKVALKVLPKRKNEDEKQRQVRDILREATILDRVHCRGSPQLIDCVQTRNEIALAMELMDGLELGKILRKTGAFPEQLAGAVIHELLRMLAELHERNCIHRDVKPDNILLSVRHHRSAGRSESDDEEAPSISLDGFCADKLVNAAKAGTLCVSLVDFGFARVVGGAPAGSNASTASFSPLAGGQGEKLLSKRGFSRSSDALDSPTGEERRASTANKTSSGGSGTGGVGATASGFDNSNGSNSESAGSSSDRLDTLLTQGGGSGKSPVTRTPTGPGECSPSPGSSTFPVDATTVFLSTCGSERFMAPELLKVAIDGSHENPKGKKRTTVEFAKKVDVYSLGVVTFVLLSGCFPFNGKSKPSLLAQSLGGPKFLSSAWSNVSPEAKRFIAQLMAAAPESRLSASEALQHEWWKKLNANHDHETKGENER